MTIIKKFLSYIGFSYEQLAMTVAVCVLCFFGGMTVASHWAAKSVMQQAEKQVTKAQTVAAKEAKALTAANQKTQKQQQVADAYATKLDNLANELAEARHDKAVAYIHGSKNNAKDINTDTVIGSSELRGVLDYSTGSCYKPGDGDSSGKLNGGAKECAPTSDVTLGNLEDGYAKLGKAYQNLKGQLVALQENLKKTGLYKGDNSDGTSDTATAKTTNTSKSD